MTPPPLPQDASQPPEPAPDAPPIAVAAMDNNTLLTAIPLRLASECRTALACADRLVVKYEPRRTYLNVTPQQWAVLQTFGAGQCVPPVLFQLISDRRCPPLREFYELVVKAYHCGILQNAATPDATEVTTPATDWRMRVPGRWVRRVIPFAILAALVALILRPLQLPTQVLELIGGWLLGGLATSAGYWLAAGVVRDANAEVYAPTWRWKTLFPHFRVDLGDAIMGGQITELDACLARLFPVFTLLAITALVAPGLVLPLFCTLLFHLSPFWWSPGLLAVHALYGTPQLDALRRFLFEPNQVFWVAIRTRIKHADRRFLHAHAVHTGIWLALVLLAGSLLLRANAVDLWQAYWDAGGLHFTALALLVLLGLMVLGGLAAMIWLGVRLGRERYSELRKKLLRPKPAAATPAAVAEMVARTLLFRHLEDEDRAAIAAAIQPEEFPAQAMVMREGEPGDNLYVVLSGRVEVLREMPNGRPEPVAVLAEGDLFGEIALLHEGGRRTRSVRTLEKSVLLSLDRENFQRLVLSKMSRDRVEDLIQKVAFLHRIPLAHNWSPHAMIAFARRSEFADFKEGDLLLREKDDNQRFFLLYEGELAVRRSRQEVARLHAGDFFGEISLLQNSVTTATIAARTPVRCLVLDKKEFLHFLSYDFLIGLQFEAISSQRLGEPIFPLKGKSFDVLKG